MIERFFPFHSLQLHSNPFRALTDEEWMRVAVLRDDVRMIVDQPQSVQILGAMGSGKTTTLLGLVAVLRERGFRVAYEYVPHGQRHFTTDTTHLAVFLLDEVQRLGWWERRRLLRLGQHGVRLIMGSHADLMGPCTRAHVPLTTISLDQINHTQLATILHRRIAWAAVDQPPNIIFAPDAIDFLWSMFGVQLRAMEHFLYDVFQRLEQPGVLTAAQLETIAQSWQLSRAPHGR